jgi:N-acetylmuramoyl-L-alanine amidase
MSRETDVTKSLATRCSEANTWGANIVVSIHCNAYTDSNASGTETYVYKKGSRAEQIANQVQKNLVATLGTKDRGVKKGNLAMVRDTVAPAILCELAFITNKNDCAKVNNATGQKKCAVAICKGICSYLGLTYKGETTVSTVKNDYSKHWAKNSIQKMVDTKIMIGDGKGTFRPDDKITRAEVAQTITNLLKYLGK